MDKFCSNCGEKISEDSLFCELCGTKIINKIKDDSIDEDSNNIEKKTQTKMKTEEQNLQEIVSKNIIKGTDGVYRWNYEMNMWKNFTLLITLWKVFMLCGSLPIVFVGVLELFENGLVDAVTVFVPMIITTAGIVTILVIVVYPIVTIANGGKYQVVFELDSKGVNHIQMQKQFKKNQVIAKLTILAGIVGGNVQTTGVGLLAMSKQSSYSEFKKVKKITCKASRDVIYVNESIQHNQVYVLKEDFDKVKRYIVSYCEAAKLEDT